MTKIALVSTSKGCIYDGKRLKPGAEFETRGESDARLLIALKRADFAPAMRAADPELVAEVEAAPGPAASFTNTQSIAEPMSAAIVTDAPSVDTADTAQAQLDHQTTEQLTQAPAESEPTESVKPRRTYRRRDMQAEGNAD